jgi:hypothetical protein
LKTKCQQQVFRVLLETPNEVIFLKKIVKRDLGRYSEPEPSSELPKHVTLRFDEYDFSLKLLRDKVENSLADIEDSVSKQVELKSQNSSQYVIREISKLQGDLTQAHSLDIKKMQDENVQHIRKVKKVEFYFPIFW